MRALSTSILAPLALGALLPVLTLLATPAGSLGSARSAAVFEVPGAVDDAPEHPTGAEAFGRQLQELLGGRLGVALSAGLSVGFLDGAPPAHGAPAEPAAAGEEEEAPGPLFSVANLFTLLMLIFLQAVLGFDNLLYISIESKRVPKDRQAFVRKTGIGLAIALRIVLLFVLVKAIDSFKEPFLSWQASVGAGELNVHALIVLVGGAFIVYTAVKELTHMLSVHDLGKEGDGAPQRSVKSAIGMIVVMNLVFSFDSILSAIALTDVFLVMAAAIIISGVMMIVLADHVARFLEKNRLFEVLGLFILFLVGVMLLSEGGHLAHLSFFGHAIEPMAKSTFPPSLQTGAGAT